MAEQTNQLDDLVLRLKGLALVRAYRQGQGADPGELDMFSRRSTASASASSRPPRTAAGTRSPPDAFVTSRGRGPAQAGPLP